MPQLLGSKGQSLRSQWASLSVYLIPDMNCSDFEGRGFKVKVT